MSITREVAVGLTCTAGSLATSVTQGGDIVGWIKELGFPVAIVAVFVLAIWKIGRWAAPLLGNAIERFVTSHERLVDSVVEQGASNTETIKTMSETLRKLEAVQVAQTSSFHRQETILKELADKKPGR